MQKNQPNFLVTSFERTIMDESNLTNCSINGANMRNINLKKANLENANLDSCDLLNANFTGAKLIGTSFKGANLEGADFSDVVWIDLTAFNLEILAYWFKQVDEENLTFKLISNNVVHILVYVFVYYVIKNNSKVQFVFVTNNKIAFMTQQVAHQRSSWVYIPFFDISLSDIILTCYKKRLRS